MSVNKEERRRIYKDLISGMTINACVKKHGKSKKAITTYADDIQKCDWRDLVKKYKFDVDSIPVDFAIKIWLRYEPQRGNIRDALSTVGIDTLAELQSAPISSIPGIKKSRETIINCMLKRIETETAILKRFYDAK